MSLPAALSRVLRPGVQVPLANACGFGALAALVMHVSRTAEMRTEAFSLGILVTSLSSAVVLRVLFARSQDAHSARSQAFLWPPLVGAVAGAAGDAGMHLHGHLSLSMAGIELGGGVPEAVAIAVLSGLAGLVGTVVLLPQVRVLVRARDTAGDASARVALTGERLAFVMWGVALGLAALACSLARRREAQPTLGLAVAGFIGLAGQCLRGWQARGVLAAPLATPYR